MKSIFIIAVFSLLTGCSDSENHTSSESSINKYKYKTIKVDGCEYLQFTNGYHHGLSHKGNCSNCNKENRK